VTDAPRGSPISRRPINESSAGRHLIGVEAMLSQGSALQVLERTYDARFRDLARLCRALGAGPDAEDIAQDVLIYAREHVHELRELERMEAWLRTIAVRRVGRHREQRSSTQLPEDILWSPPNPDARIDIAAAIARLPRREREALALVYGLGYRQEEAAAALNVRRGTIAASLFHARVKLAEWLKTYETRR
jgi:RNA polymerase sigma factor (sigma-70 family)